MRITQILIMMAALTSFVMVGSAFAANYYVVQNQVGRMAVVEGHHYGPDTTVHPAGGLPGYTVSWLHGSLTI